MKPNLDLDKFPHSTYADQLRDRRRRMRFPPELEEEYLDEHLRRAQPRVRIWTTMAALLALGFTIAQVLQDGKITASVLVHLFIILPVSFGLVWLAWSPGHMRAYLRIAQPLTPLLGAAVAVAVAEAVAQGYPEELASLTLLLIAAFFFMGLKFRAALVTGISIFAAYTITAWLQGIPAALFAKSTLFLGIATGLGAAIGRDVEHSYRRRFLEQSLLAELADRDSLTGIRNRRAFDEHLARIWQQSLRGRTRLAVLLIDIDFFKRYNDHYGHQAGDKALQQVAQVIEDFARRPLDIAARYGGEEFTIVAYDLDDDAVDDIAERLCVAVEALEIEHAGSGCSRFITISVGVGIVQPQINRTPQGILQLADEALYEAKARGRNRAVVRGQASYEILITGTYKNPEFAQRNRRRARTG